MYKKVHFIGIGGIGMSGIAQLFLAQGVQVSGSDIRDSERLQELRQNGAQIYIGHHPSHIKDVDLVVYSSAIKEDNPELEEAQKRGFKVVKRAEALAEIIQHGKVITVSGSHGKTTTTSLVAHILFEAGFYPTVVVGGIWLNLNSNAYLGKDNFFVIETDESDGSFLFFKPDYSIITNIDYEHLDYYKNFDRLLDSFNNFIENIKPAGCLIACGEDKNVFSLLNKASKRKVIYGLSPEYDIYAYDINLKRLFSDFNCTYARHFTERFMLSLGGVHNVLNSLAAIALAKELEIDLEIVKRALLSFKGTRRRIEIKADIQGVLFIDDYAHHPTEIKATLKTVANLGYKRVIAVFQPHRYTRTKLLLDEFAQSFYLADEVIITDIYPADEKPIEGINAELLYERFKFYKHPAVKFLPKKEIADCLLNSIKTGDLLITLGAGDIYKTNEELVQRFKERFEK